MITWGESVVLKASFGTIGANQTFTLQGTRDGMIWAPITTLTTDADGNASFTYRPANNLYYRGVSVATPELAGRHQQHRSRGRPPDRAPAPDDERCDEGREPRSQGDVLDDRAAIAQSTCRRQR